MEPQRGLWRMPNNLNHTLLLVPHAHQPVFFFFIGETDLKSPTTNRRPFKKYKCIFYLFFEPCITFSALPPLEAPDAMCPSASTQITPTVSMMQSSSKALEMDNSPPPFPLEVSHGWASKSKTQMQLSSNKPPKLLDTTQEGFLLLLFLLGGGRGGGGLWGSNNQQYQQISKTFLVYRIRKYRSSYKMSDRKHNYYIYLEEEQIHC